MGESDDTELVVEIPSQQRPPSPHTLHAPHTLHEFEAEVAGWLEANAELKPEKGRFQWGEGDDAVVEIWTEHHAQRDAALLDAARAWRRARFDAGFGWIDGPPELGGRGLPSSFARAYAKAEARFGVPAQDWFKLAPVIGPILMAHASPEIQQRYVPGLYRGDLVACELFSEPGAGSDLASVTCSARPWAATGRAATGRAADGASPGGSSLGQPSSWVLDGQKVWTSDANIADIGLVLARTDSPHTRHRGLTTFLVDMHDPAIEVRPLRQMTGGAAFNEVFISGLTVPDTHRIGEVNGGWKVAVHTLMFERQLVAGGHGRGGVGIANGERLLELVRHFGLADDPLIRQELAAIITAFRVAGYLNRRRDLPPDALIMAKLSLAQNLSAVSRFLGRVLGPRLVADTGQWGTYAWTRFVLGAPGNHIAVGTDEVIKNIIGERILGLPKEPPV